MQTALYLRVSTAQQKPDLQDDGLRAYAARAGLEIVATYVDHAVSGRQETRPQLQALMQAARRQAFACVLVWKFDRFARSVTHLLRALEEFDYLRIRFISVQDQVDTASPMGKAMFTIIGAMAELESALISERVKAGMAAARRAGNIWAGRRLLRLWWPDRRVGGHDVLEYSPDSRRLSRACQPFRGGCDRPACPSPSGSRIPVTSFYTYPDHTPRPLPPATGGLRGGNDSALSSAQSTESLTTAPGKRGGL